MQLNLGFSSIFVNIFRKKKKITLETHLDEVVNFDGINNCVFPMLLIFATPRKGLL
jgi:hypothetical protein